MNGNPSPFTRIGMHAGDGSSAYCFTCSRTSPILDIRTGDTSISISVTGREHVDDPALSFARELLKAAQDFAAGVERIHAERATAEPAGRAA
jgi:hypothetical protein